MWLSGTRALIVAHRTSLAEAVDLSGVAEHLSDLIDRMLRGLAASAARIQEEFDSPTDAAGRPLPARRAG